MAVLGMTMNTYFGYIKGNHKEFSIVKVAKYSKCQKMKKSNIFLY